MKHVALPVRQVAPRQSLRGFKEDFSHLTADVVLLSGEIHLGRKPVSILYFHTHTLKFNDHYWQCQGALRFTSSHNQDNFSRLVLHQMRPTDKILNLGSRLHERMSERNGGRMWMGAHMRRGDCM